MRTDSPAAPSRPVGGLLAAILDALASAPLEFVVARNYQGYPRSVTGDVDLVVPSGQQDRAIDIVVDAARACGWGPFLVIRRGYLAYIGLVAATRVADRGVLVVEFFDGGVWAGMPFLPARTAVEQARVWTGGWRVLRPGHEAAMTAFHHLLWNGAVPSKYWRRVRELVQADADGFAEASRTAFGSGLGRLVVADVARGEFRALSARTGACRRAVALRSLLRGRFPVVEAVKAVLGRRAVGGGMVFGVAGDDARELGATMMDVADEWHIGSPAARDRVHLDPEAPAGLRERATTTRARGGVLVLSARRATGLAEVGVVCDATLPEGWDRGDPADVAVREGWRRLLAAVAFGGGGTP